jgi:aminoglycoside phosphotransferase family enzyme
MPVNDSRGRRRSSAADGEADAEAPMSQARAAPPPPTEAAKVAFLSRPDSWPHRPAGVEVVQTHMSWVFLAGPRVYKLKKPVRTAFLDFSTLARRRAAVADELRLNRRLAPDVYLGKRALRMDAGGGLTLGPAGQVADWLVEMRRLPEDRTLHALIVAGRARPDDLGPLAAALVAFYRGLPPAPIAPARYAGNFEAQHVVTARALSDPQFGVEPGAVSHALGAFETALAALRPALEARVRAGRVVEGHGDLRPEHVFLTDPPVVIDSLEFNQGLRTVDPFDELAFLGLECARLGAGWVLPTLRAPLERGLGEEIDPALLAFYWRYRALLRARLAILHLAAPEQRDPERWAPLARRYLALAEEAEVRTSRR